MGIFESFSRSVKGSQAEIVFALDNQPDGALAEFEPRVELSGWAVLADGSAPIELVFVIDGEEIATFSCSEPRRDIFINYPESAFSLCSGFKFTFNYETLMQIERGRLSLKARGPGSQPETDIWTWNKGFSKGSASAAAASIKADLLALASRVSVKGNRSSAGLAIILKGDPEKQLSNSLWQQLGKLGPVALAIEVKGLVKTVQKIDKLPATVSESFDLDNFLGLGKKDFSDPEKIISYFKKVGLKDEGFVVFLDLELIDANYVDFSSLVSDFSVSLGSQVISCASYGHKSGLKPPSGLHLSQVSDLLQTSPQRAPVLLRGKLGTVWITQLQDLTEILCLEPSIQSELSHVDISQVVGSDRSEPELDSENLFKAQALFDSLSAKAISSQKNSSSDGQKAMIVLPPNWGELSWLETRQDFLLSLADSLTKEGVGVFFVTENQAESPELFGPWSCVPLSQVVDFLGEFGRGCIIFSDWLAVRAANTLAYQSGFPVAGLVDELPGRRFEEQDAEKRLLVEWAISSKFVPLLRSGSKVLGAEKLLEAEGEAIHLDEKSLPGAGLVQQIFETAKKIESRLKKERSFPAPIDIIVPVYNALDAVVECLRVAVHLVPEGTRIIVVDDCSDSYTAEWLRKFSEEHSSLILLLRQETNQGFVQACKRGFAACRPEADVVLLNSDVVLTPGALGKLKEAAYSRCNVAAASALSTGSPHLQLDLNPGDSIWDAADYLDSQVKPEHPTIITPEGQFLYLRRWALNKFGFLDDVYRRGFCEESDLCLRFFLHGADTVCAENALIFHRRAASFGEETKGELVKKNRPLFEARWGRYYWPLYEAFKNFNPLAKVRAQYAAGQVLLPEPEIGYSLLGSWKEINTPAAGNRPRRVLGDAEVVFVLPSVVLGGGSLSVLQHVNELLLRGVKARVLSLSQPAIKNYPLFAPIISVDPKEILSLDWSNQRVVATFWLTAYFVEAIGKANPDIQGFYYVQDYEPWFYSYPEDYFSVKDAEESYNLNLTQVAKTGFLQQQVGETHGSKVDLVRPGINRGVFYAGDQQQYLGPPRIAAMYRPSTARRGSSELLQVLEQVIERLPEAEISLFGGADNLPGTLVGKCNLLGRLSPQQVGELYRNSDIVLDFSWWHGFGRMGIEAMCCGAVPLLSDSGGISSYACDRENSFIVPVGEISSAVEKLIILAVDRELRLALRKNALASSSSFSEFYACNDWVEILGLASNLKIEVDSLPVSSDPKYLGFPVAKNDKASLRKL